MPHACVGSECMASAALPASTRKMSLRMRWPGRVRHFLLSPEAWLPFREGVRQGG